MRRKFGILLILIGVLFAGWNGYSWLSEMSSGQEPIGESDIAEVDEIDEIDEIDELESKSLEVSTFLKEKTQAKNSEVPIEEGSKFSSKKAEKPEEPKQRDYKEYERGEKIGWLLIPSLDKKYPIYWGTDDETLTQGVGYHAGEFTTPPDEQRHTVLSGHRDTVFNELGDLKEGDSMYMHFEDVQYEYKIKRIWVTSAEDRTVIVAKNKPILTLTTCYPFTFLGAAPDRYIIEAPLVGIAKIKS